MAETTVTPSPKVNGKTTKTTTGKTPAAKKAARPAARKAQENKTTITSAKTARKKATVTSISTKEHQRLIAEAAYLRAERRNFIGGDPVTDWLEAEADVLARMNAKKAPI